MSDWVPLDERELLQGDDEVQAYHDNNSPQEQNAPAGSAFLQAESFADLDEAGPPGNGGGGGGGPRREVTRDMILRALEKQGNRRRPGAGVDDPYAEDRFLAAQSHLHLNGRGINRIANLRPMSTLEVLYMYDNQISVIENLSFLRRLTHLYLANNCIREISGLAGLVNLQKLYIEHNCIQVVSGLEACPSLEELHISSQRLPPGIPLSFHPSTITALGPSLRILAASATAISSTSLPQLAGLNRLRRLDLSHNAIDAFAAVDAAVQSCVVLSYLDLRGNPVCRLPKYRDTVILMNDSITSLDDEPIPAQHREFILRLHIRRMKAQLAAELKEDAAPPPQQQQPSLPPLPGHVDAYGHAGGGTATATTTAGGGGGVPSRVPPRMGGFHPAAGGGGTGGSGRTSVTRNLSGGSGSGGLGSGRTSGTQGITRGMEGMSFR